MDFAAIVTNVVAAFAHVGGQALDAAQTTAEALLIALTIIAALFQTSKLVTVYRGGTQLSGASVLYDPLYETRTRSLPASAPTASIAVPLRAGDDYPPIPLHETIRLAFMLFTLVLIVCAVVCQAVSNVTDRPNGSKPADRVARPTRRRILDLVPQQLPDEFPTVQGLNFVESPLVEFYIVDPLEDIPPSSSSTSNPAASSVVKTTPESQEQTKHDEPAPLPIPVDDPTRLAKKQRRKERQTAKKALLLKPITTQHPYSPDSGLAPSSSCEKVVELVPSSSTQSDLSSRSLAAVESTTSKATSVSTINVVVPAAVETLPIPSIASAEAVEPPTDATAPSTTTDTPPSPTTPKASAYFLPKASDAVSETLSQRRDEEVTEYDDDDDGSSTVVAPEDARPSLGVEEDSSTDVEEDLPAVVKDDSSAIAKSAAAPSSGNAQPVIRGLNLRGPGSGLINPRRKTCYVNSVLQVLLHTPLVLQSVLEHKCSNPDFCLLCAFKTTALKMYAKDTAPFVPTEIIGNMTKFTELSPYRQEDAQEFLQAVINHLDHTTSSAIDSSLVEQVFQGSERYRRECAACGQREDRFQPFRTLRLNLKETVEAALKELTSKQAVEDASCDGCNRRGHRSETNTIHDAPRILALQLKRFTHVLTKLSGSCGYTEILDIEPYMSTSNTDPTASTQHNDRPSTLYRLYAVVCHIGPAIHQGHYLAWVKTGEGKWAIMNDSSVIVTDTLSASEEDGYLFFYERVDGAEAEALRADMQVPQEAANLRRRARQTLANVRGPLAATEEGWTTVQVRKQRAKQEQPKADKGSQEKREKHASSGKGKGERKGKKQTRTTR